MRKKIVLATLMVVLLAGFIGCTKDDDPIPASNKTTTATSNTNTGGSSTTNGSGTTTSGSNTGGTGSGSTTGTTTASTVDKATLLQLVNDVRAKGCNCGSTYMQPVGPVAWNDKLEQAALAHSQDMNKNSYFDHTGLDGSTPGTRVTLAGYQWMAVGENIALGYTSEKAVVDAWIASEDHCKNIMNGLFTDMGVARDGLYWTQEFGDPKK